MRYASLLVLLGTLATPAAFAQPNLIATLFDLSPIRVDPGDAFAVSVTARSAAEGTTEGSPASTVGFYASNDRFASSDDVLLGTAPLPAIGRGQTAEIEAAVSVPELERGGYYFIAVLDYDNEVAETDETDNDQTALFTVGGAEGPDLAFNAVELEDATAEPGDRVQVEFTLANRGFVDVEDFEVSYYLSRGELPADGSPAPGAILLEREVIGNLEAGEEEDESEEVTIPEGTPLGGYSFAIVLDEANEIEELNETNNRATRGIQITGGTAVEELADESASGIAVWPNPAVSTVTVSYSLSIAGPVQLSLYDALGREVVAAVNAMQPGGAHEAALDVSALPPGRYALVLTASGERRARAVSIVR